MDNIPSKSSKFSKISIHLASLEIEEGLEMGQEPSRVRYFRLYSIEKIENIEPNIEYRKKMIDGQDWIGIGINSTILIGIYQYLLALGIDRGSPDLCIKDYAV